METLPETISTTQQLDELLSRPRSELVEFIGKLRGDLLIIGAGGKIGPSLARMAHRAVQAAGAKTRVIAVDAGKLDAGSVIDAKALIASGALRRERDGVRLLARGELKTKLTFKVAKASAAAVKAVEAAGGSVEILMPREDRLAGDGKRAARRRAAHAKRESRQPKAD